MKLQIKCNNKMASCGGETCNKCCQDPGGKGKCAKQETDPIRPEDVKEWISIIKKSGKTFMYSDSDIQAIENLLTQMHARGILPKEILRIQIMRDGSPSIYTIVLNSRTDKLANRTARMRAGCKKTPYSNKYEVRPTYKRKVARHHRKKYKGEGEA